MRTPRGRVATDAAFRHVGLEPAGRDHGCSDCQSGPRDIEPV